MPQTLQIILVLLAAAVLVVVLCRQFQLPPVLGYLLVGVAVGPHALAWVPDTHQTRYLAEFGVVFLMFSIGLEFSLPQLKAMRRSVFGLGAAQVLITLALGLGACVALGYDWRMGIALGGALAMSSTAIVSKMLAERMEIGTPHGRDAMGVLLFQDLAVVPLLIVVPALALPVETLATNLAAAALKAVVALALILVFGQRLVREWFHLVARQRSGELFMLNILLITLGLAGLTEMAGLSLALGAFLAGMLIAETEFRYQVEEDIKPFRDVLLGLFFVTLGMLLDLSVVLANLGWVVVLLVLPVTFKALLVVGLARAFGANLGAALRTGFYLAQAGEFAFVILAQASGLELVDAQVTQVVLAAMLLSMLTAPLLIQYADPLARKLTANDWLARAAELHQIAVKTMARQDHVIVCGFGRSGQNLGRLLEQQEIRYIALDADPQRVREAAAEGGSVVYGDAGRREALMAAGLTKARAVAVTYADVASALKVIHHVHSVRPDLPVIVRTRDDADLDRLLLAGAAEVVPEVLEGSLMLASHSLLLLGVPLNRVLKLIRAVREERYGLFRGFFHGSSDAADAADNLQPRLHSVLLPEGAGAVDKRLADLGLEGLVEVTGVRRRNARLGRPEADFVFEPGDLVVLLGRPEELLLAERRLLENSG
ncbi:MAG: potassium transporter [Burkholderiales bacterium]|nr:MAG: potassium transporter [Burkholderiales bacterium]